MSRIIKILIAAILVGGLVFAGVTTYMEHKRIEEDANAALMDMLIEKNEDENANEKITYVDVEEKEEIEKIEKYISRIFLNFPGGSPLPEVTDVDDIGEDYIEHLVYLNRDLVKSDNGEEIDFSEETVRYYSYPELNRVAVELLGKEVHNKLPNQSGDYFMKSTDKQLYTYTNILEYIDGEYVITNKISDFNIREMRLNMNDADAEIRRQEMVIKNAQSIIDDIHSELDAAYAKYRI